MATDDPAEVHVSLDRIEACAHAVLAFAAEYRNVDPVDTSPEERLRLREAAEHLERALNCFS